MGVGGAGQEVDHRGRGGDHHHHHQGHRHYTVQVFHYFMVKAARIPLLTSISWGAAFLLYYGLLLCCSQLYGLTLALSAALLLPGDATLFGTRRDIFLPFQIFRI